MIPPRRPTTLRFAAGALATGFACASAPAQDTVPPPLRPKGSAAAIGNPAGTDATPPSPPERAKAKAERAAKGGKGRRAPGAAEEGVRRALSSELTDYMPVGRAFEGVAIPSYSGEKLKSVMTADTVTRVDDRVLDLVNLVVKVYDEAGEHEATIAMDEAAYDLVADELTSKTPSSIEQTRFTMTGDTMIFQNQTQVARLVGNVRLVVPDASRFAPEFGLPGEKRGAPRNP